MKESANEVEARIINIFIVYAEREGRSALIFLHSELRSRLVCALKYAEVSRSTAFAKLKT
jgi:hypothetical protein